MAQVGRPRKEEFKQDLKVEVKKAVIVEDKPSPEATKTALEQAQSNKMILDASNTEKAHKDILLKNAKELEAHINFLRQRMIELDQEYQSRKKLVDGINGSIAGAQSELTSLRSQFEKNNAALTAKLEKDRKELVEADKVVQRLKSEAEALLRSNQQREGALIQESANCKQQVLDMKRALAENQAQWDKREKDILVREAELAKERIAFEAEKEALIPEQARLSSVKNENTLLLQEVEQQRANLRNFMLGIESEKQVLHEQKVLQENTTKQALEKLANEEARLRRWEEDLKQYALEVEAKRVMADKQIKQFQLESVVKSEKAKSE